MKQVSKSKNSIVHTYKSIKILTKVESCNYMHSAHGCRLVIIIRNRTDIAEQIWYASQFSKHNAMIRNDETI